MASFQLHLLQEVLPISQRKVARVLSRESRGLLLDPAIRRGSDVGARGSVGAYTQLIRHPHRALRYRRTWSRPEDQQEAMPRRTGTGTAKSPAPPYVIRRRRLTSV